jgi:excinuclease ABC subunit B
MYADKMTRSMAQTIDETNRRREKQLAYNEKHHITPTAIIKSVTSIMDQTGLANNRKEPAYIGGSNPTIAADPVVQYMSRKEIELAIDKNKKDMQAAVKLLDFIEAARLRDENRVLSALLDERA